MNYEPEMRIPKVRAPSETAASTLSDDAGRRTALARQEMIEQHLRGRDIINPRVIEAMMRVPRELFVPESERPRAYADQPINIGYGQTISQPYIAAKMTEALAPRTGDRILELGGGCGYQSAVLMELGAIVYVVEIIPELAEALGKRLAELGYRHFEVSCHDGHMGWNEFAPYDAVIAAAAMPEVPPAIFEQVKVGGRIVAPIGTADGEQTLTRFMRKPDGWTREAICPVRFVPFVGQ